MLNDFVQATLFRAKLGTERISQRKEYLSDKQGGGRGSEDTLESALLFF